MTEPTHQPVHQPMHQTGQEAAAWLRSLPAVRARCHAVYALAEAGRTPHFTLQAERLEAVADFWEKVARQGYPKGAIPNHSKLLDFGTGGIPRIPHLLADWMLETPLERSRRLVDLLVVGVLLDAGAGPTWEWRDMEHHAHRMAEGLALATLNLFVWCGFSSNPKNKHQVDGPGLQALTLDQFTHAMQAREENPLPGLEGRWQLLQRLGALLTGGSPYFQPPSGVGGPARPGYLVDWLLARQASAGRVSVTDLWEVLQDGLGPVWPTDRGNLDGQSLGDAWHYAPLESDAPGGQVVPFHKLTQWLAHSLLDTLAEAGLVLEDQHLLTGLAEYRNGALFIDLGVLTPRDDALLSGEHGPEEEAIVEWRALTVALIDKLALLLRNRLSQSEADLSISQVLQGGTWRAGRVLSRSLRPNGEPPIRVRIDGTVF